MGKHLIEMTPKELNSLLKKEYCFGLYPFAIIVAHVFLVGGVTKSENFPCNEDLAELQRKFLYLKRKIIHTLSYHYLNIILYQNRDPSLKKILKKDMDYAEALIGDFYGLNGFFKYINGEIKNFDELKKDRQPGARLKKRNFIITLWSQLVRSEGYRINWEIIADLIDWFWEKLRFYSFYSELNPQRKPLSDPDVLKNMFYRNKELTREHFLDIRDGYFNNRLKNRRKFSLLVIFSKSGIKIEKYSDLLEFYNGTLRRKHKKYITLLEKILEGDFNYGKLPRSIWATDACAYYATKLYKKNPKSPPRLIFPDLSHL
jgi:hypothetical protein